MSRLAIGFNNYATMLGGDAVRGLPDSKKVDEVNLKGTVINDIQPYDDQSSLMNATVAYESHAKTTTLKFTRKLTVTSPNHHVSIVSRLYLPLIYV